MSTTQSDGQQAMGQDARKLAELTDVVLFGDIWERPELTKRERSIVTVSALVAMYRIEQLPFHLNRALENGVTKDGRLVELLTATPGIRREDVMVVICTTATDEWSFGDGRATLVDDSET